MHEFPIATRVIEEAVRAACFRFEGYRQKKTMTKTSVLKNDVLTKNVPLIMSDNSNPDKMQMFDMGVCAIHCASFSTSNYCHRLSCNSHAIC